MERFIDTNHITLHTLEHPGGEPTLVFLPGLTANAHSFTAVAEHLSPLYRVLALDLRGRGQSSKPAYGYTLAEHAADILGVLDAEGISQATLVGHSFGGLLGMYMAANFPQRLRRLVIIDISKAATHPGTLELIKPSLDRLGRTLPSVEAYLAAMRQMPFFEDAWDRYVEAFYRADMRVNEDGTAQAHSTPEAIGAAVEGIIGQDWDDIFSRIHCPALLLNATAPYGPPGAPPLVPAEAARETVDLIANCRYVHVPGNHITLLFGPNAKEVANAIKEFI